MPYQKINDNLEKLPKAFEFCALLNDAKESENFLFFTDTHLYNKGEMSDEQEQARAQLFLGEMERYYAATPMNFILDGGDWLGDNDTMAEAKGKLCMVDAYMRAHFHDYYPVLGNHDSNYQGVDENGVQLGADRGMSPAESANLRFRAYGHPYYSFNGAHTTFFVLDSQIDWNATVMNDYKWEQMHFVAKGLQTDAARHYAIAIHMWWWYELTSPDAAMVAELKKIILAYNGREKLKIQDTAYDFTQAQGRIEFVISGHMHRDLQTQVGTCPVIATTLIRETGDASFDMVYADYDNRRLHCVRVGVGENRTFDLDTGERILS